MPVPTGLILAWPGTAASIPSLWTRETALDDKFPKHSGGQDPNTVGGSNTHTHDGSHTHTLTSHQHTYVTGISNEWSTVDYSGSSADGGENNICAKHDHGTGTSTSIVGGSLQSAGLWASADNRPPFYEVIFIKPSGVSAPIWSGILSHFYGSSAPAGWNYCNGASSTPDLRNKYLKGAPAAGNGGGTGGSLTHNHDLTHTHTANAHYHSGNTPNNGNPNGARQSSGTNSSGEAGYTHQHAVVLDWSTDSIANYSGSAGSADTVEPAFKKLGAIQNALGTSIVHKGMIGWWIGSVASIPVGWHLCDGSNGTPNLVDKFIKIGADLTENDAIGGSNTHVHSSVSHTHSPTGTHTHSGSSGGSLSNWQRRGPNQGQGVVRYYDTHNISSVQNVSASYSTDLMTCATVDNQPYYLTAAYIMALADDPGGAALFGIL